MTTVIKKDGAKEPFNPQKIAIASQKAAVRCDVTLTDKDLANIIKTVETKIEGIDEVPVSLLHELTIASLSANGFKEVSASYAEYRYYKTQYAKTFEKLHQDADDVLRLGDRENANFDSALVSTKGSLIKGYLTKSLYKQFYMSKQEKFLIDRGDIYAHDLRDMILGCVNCFRGSTRFISSFGLRSFNSFRDGATVYVPSHRGIWRKATVHKYGKQALQKVFLKRGAGKEREIWVTANHRWILKDGTQTTNLKVGDRLCDTPNITQYSWDNLSMTDKRIWCLGFNKGDGTANSWGSVIRLCGDKNKWAGRFEEAGFFIRKPLSYEGDLQVSMPGVRDKHVPFEVLTHENLKVYAHGLMCADGEKNVPGRNSEYRGIQVTGDFNSYVAGILSAGGYYVTSQRDVTDVATNFGERSALTIHYQLYSSVGDLNWRVTRIEETDKVENVWCLEVEEDHSFLLEGGIPTGNCCLFDIGEVLRGGFEMSNVQYTEPKTVLSALQVIGDITLVATAQQFGGFTLPALDQVLLPYVKKSYNAAYYRYHNELGLEKDRSERQARLDTIRELEQGFQSLELKLNTVPCSRGDFAFTTVSFGQWDYEHTSKDDSFWLMTIGKVILKTRREGHGKNHRPVVFPKLIFTYDKKQIDADVYTKDLFEEAVKTSAKCMYPDYLSVSSKYGAVSQLFQKAKVVTNSMGCRAYLTPWANEKGEYITTGRCNIGAVSLNLPLILRIVQYQHPDDWKEAFWPELDERLEVIREFLKKRYDVIRHQKCSSNPLAFTQGGFYEGHKTPDEEVGDLVRYMTASFGITALDQTTFLWEGKRIAEDQSFAVKLLKHIQAKIDEYKHEDGYLYAIYGTPAESLCGTQAKQYDKWCKDVGVDNVFRHAPHYNPDYFTNSFHCNVTEDLTPFEKQDKEFECFHLAQGGHIQYVRIDNPDNLDALKAVIERGMEKGFYQGVNFDAVYCNNCGQHSTNALLKCPHCGSRNISVISRVSGYLGYTNVNGKTRMNDGKLAEIRDRKSM